jgi:UDP-N-acetylmuramyl pentapeptide phosphotransferase/UDP-N-acetylglucosamine-1-phosphate transferase
MPDSAEALRLWTVGGALIAPAAAVASAASISLLSPILRRYALAHPNARSSHREPTPQGGGLAVVASTILVTLAAALAMGDMVLEPAAQLPLVLGATVFIAIVGAIVDLRPVAIPARLVLQTAAAVAIIVALPADMSVASALPWWVERAMLLFCLLWFVNLVNFMDGIDWMTVVEVVPIAAGLTLIGIAGALPPPAIIVALALGGAMVGFAPFNRPVAKIFLGDAGSLPIGLLLGWLLLLLAARGHVAAALLLPLYYLADATITLLRRLVNGEPFWQAHRTHFYQRATDRGYSVSDVVSRVFAVNLGLAGLAVATVIVNDATTDIAALACGCAVVAWLLMTFKRGKR